MQRVKREDCTLMPLIVQPDFQLRGIIGLRICKTDVLVKMEWMQ